MRFQTKLPALFGATLVAWFGGEPTAIASETMTPTPLRTTIPPPAATDAPAASPNATATSTYIRRNPAAAPATTTTTTMPSSMPSSPSTLLPTVPATPEPTASAAPTSQPTTQPTTRPSFSDPVTVGTLFRQELNVDRDGLEFTPQDVIVFEQLYQRSTADFSPLPPDEVASMVSTRCAVERQFYATEGVLSVIYNMTYSSRHHNVTLYPLLFQNWTNSNLDDIMEHLLILRMNVTSLGSAVRLTINTSPPTAAPSPE